MDYIIIKRYLDGKASEAEITKIYKWVEAAPGNREELIQYKKLWAMTAHAGEDQKYAWEKVMLEKIKGRQKLNYFMKYLRYAAVILFALGLGAVLHTFISGQFSEDMKYMADTRIEIPAGQMSKVVLPDGTVVQLNSGSTLMYNGEFFTGKRTVNLEGEAFFDVSKDISHPFCVKTKSLDFRVYGTSFNIQAYPGDDINATLVEGSLGVLGKTGKEYSRLIPGENVRYKIDTRSLQVSKVNVDLYTSWREGIITFTNENLRDIARKIERWYNVEIIISNEKLAEQVYIGTLMKNKPVDQILEVLRLTSSLEYRIIQRADKPALIYWE